MDNNNDDNDPDIQEIMRRKMQDMLNQQKHGQPSASSQPSQPSAQHVINLTSATFDQTISLPQLTLVDFWAEWCGPCRTMHPAFEEANLSYPNITFARVNVDECRDIAARFNINSIPTFVMFNSGKIVDTVMGAVGLQGIRTLCQRHS